MRLSLPFFVALTSAAVGGCGAFAASTAMDRGEQKLTLDASREELRDAAVAYVGEQEWILSKSSKSLIVARTPVDNSAGLMTRDRWQFRVQDGMITAKLYLEMKDESESDAKWTATSQVGPSYSYFREHEHLRLISKRAMAERDALVRGTGMAQGLGRDSFAK